MQLLPHPSTPRGAVAALEARAARAGGGALRFGWRLTADLAALRVPAPVAAPAGEPARADGLWRHTCFEAFVAVAGRPGYCELNFSPAGSWAAYAFTGYRSGMSAPVLAAAPAPRWQRGPALLACEVTLSLDGLLAAHDGATLRVALATVVEEQSGTMSYWALRHPDGKPDFHHPDGFALELAGGPPARKGTTATP